MTAFFVTGLLSVFAVGMAATTAVTVKWTALTTGPLRASVVQFVLAMMAAMFVGVLVYFAVGGTPGLVAGLWVAAALMAASVLLVFVGFAREVRLRDRGTGPGGPPAPRTAFLASVIGLVLGNEFLMGWSFSLITNSLPVGLGSHGQGILHVVTGAITSPWFVFPMALEMAFTLGFLLDRFPSPMRRFLLVQPAVMVCSPPTIPGFPWLLGSTVGASALMAGAVAWLLIALLRGELLAPSVARYLLLLFTTFAIMAAGLYLWVEFLSAGLFALSLIAQMVVFLWAVTDPERFGSPATQEGPQRRPAPAGSEADGT